MSGWPVESYPAFSNKIGLWRQDFNLPNDSFLLVHPGLPDRIDPSILETWLDIMHEVLDSCLVLIVDNGSCKTCAIVQWIEDFCTQNSLDKSRVLFRKFQNKPKFWAMLYACGRFGNGLCLDTSLGRSIHTAAVDSFCATLPVTTCEGRGMQARVPAEIFRAIGLNDLLEGKDQDEDHAEQKAKALRC